jgi:SAM-dependent methyltransferase
VAETNNVSFGQEVGSGLEQDELPAYAPMLDAYHRACARELRGMIADLEITEGSHVLDVACGDGVYSAWLAEHVGSNGHVVGVDIAPAYLLLAHERRGMSPYADRISFEEGDAFNLPFEDDQFDLVWCAHSLYSLTDPIAALSEMRRVARPHYMLLPWPAELEIAVRQAQLAALESETSQTGRFYIGRDLCSTFGTVGIEQCSIRTYTIDRRAPLHPDERTYLELYLHDLGERAYPYLDEAAREALRIVLSPRSPLYLLDQPGFFMSHLEIVARGIKPKP